MSRKFSNIRDPHFQIISLPFLSADIVCQEDKKLQEKVFNVQEPAQIACPQAISAHPKESIMWIYNSSLRYVEARETMSNLDSSRLIVVSLTEN